MSFQSPVPLVWPPMVQRIRDAAPSQWFVAGQPRTFDDGEVPDGQPLGYFVPGSIREDPGLYYGVEGAEGEYTIHAWGVHARAARALYAWFTALFHEAALTVNGHVVEIAQVRLAGIFPDGPGNGRQAEMILTLRTQKAA